MEARRIAPTPLALAALAFAVVLAEPTKASTTGGPPDAPPAAHTGLQLGLRTGAAVPFGEVATARGSPTPSRLRCRSSRTSGSRSRRICSWAPTSASPSAGWATRSSGDATPVGVDSTAVGFRFGIQAQYHFNPDGKWNPWIGYGIGVELLGASGSKNNDKLDAGLFGVEYAHSMAGVDCRVNEVVGISPFADFALGQYGSTSLEATRNGVSRKSNGELANPSLHEWLTAGFKVTFFP